MTFADIEVGQTYCYNSMPVWVIGTRHTVCLESGEHLCVVQGQRVDTRELVYLTDVEHLWPLEKDDAHSDRDGSRDIQV